MRRTANIVGATVLFALASASAGAQARKLRIATTDSVPIVYAYVTIEGGTGQISDENGEVNLGAGKKKTVAVSVRRIGYEPFFANMELPDTAAVLNVNLKRLAQALGQVRVTGRSSSSPGMQGFYDRWMMRQKGTLSATFIGPEEIEFRHPNKITNMLNGLNGVSFRRTVESDLVAYGMNGQCQMAIVINGVRQCPGLGCKCMTCGGNVVEIGGRGLSPRDTAKLTDMNSVPIDRYVDAASVAAIEVYGRGANMPASLQVSDPACGVIAIWTGSRRP